MTHVEAHAPGMPIWVDLLSDNLEASRTFYAALFGWTFDIGPAESGHYTTCSLGGRRVAGMATKPPGPTPNAWSMYLGVTDSAAKAAAIQEAGGNLLMGPMEVFDHGTMTVAMDPTGAAFGLWQPKVHTGFQIINEPGSFAWVDLYTRDLARASEFYRRVFGYETVNMDGMPYVTLHLGADRAKVAGGIMQMDPKQFPVGVPSHWNTYFATANTDQAAAQVESLGGKVFAPGFDTEYGRIAVVADPQGATFSLIQLSAKAHGG
jgi:predicted enzyme related to lactoylglutathione lyase